MLRTVTLVSVTTVTAAPTTTDPHELTGFAGWIVDLIDSIGTPGIAIALLLENVFPPIPSEMVLPLGGFVAGQSDASLFTMILWATLGGLVGAWILYGLGYLLGPRRLAAIIDRLPLVTLDDLDKANRWFDRHGGLAVFIGRCIPIVRSLISIPAGVRRMGFVRFTIYTVLGSGIWNTLWIGLGYVVGDQWTDIGRYSNLISYGALAALAIVVLWFVVARLRRRTPTNGPS